MIFLIGKLKTKPFRSGNMLWQVIRSESFIDLGSCAGIVEHCGMFPIDTAKVNLSHLLTSCRLTFRLVEDT